MSSTVKLYEVLVDTDSRGPAGDGTVVKRFWHKADAERCAASSTAWGNPTKAVEVNAPKRLTQRWVIS